MLKTLKQNALLSLNKQDMHMANSTYMYSWYGFIKISHILLTTYYACGVAYMANPCINQLAIYVGCTFPMMMYTCLSLQRLYCTN